MRYDNLIPRGVTNGPNSALAAFAFFVLVITLVPITGSHAAAIVTTPISPKLVSPGSSDQTGTDIATLTPTLRWEGVFDAQLYSVYVRKFPFTENDVVFKAESVSKPSVQLPEGILADGEKYRWYARAFNKAGWSDKSQVFSFVVSLPTENSAPLLIAPGSAHTPLPVIMTASPTFRWKSVPNASRYGLYISKYPFRNGQFVYRNESITESTFTLPRGLLSPGKTYRWNVKIQTKSGWGDPSQRFYFAVRTPEEKMSGITNRAEADQKKPAGEASAYPLLPNNVVVEGESPRWSSFVTGLYSPRLVSADPGSRTDHISPSLLPSTTQKQLVQREIPPGTPSQPGTGPSSPQPFSPPPSPPPPSSLPGGTTVTEAPVAVPSPVPLPPKAQPVDPAPPANQMRQVQAPGAPVLPNEPRPASPPVPMSQGPQAISQPAAGMPPAPPVGPRSNGQVPGPSAGSMVQMQFDNIELRDLIKFVSNIMGKNFIFDDNVVKGKVTILSPKSLTRDEVFRVFESVLNYYGFSIVSSAEALKVVKASDAKALAIESLDKDKVLASAPEEKIATLIHPLEYLDSNTMVGILRPLMARDAYLVSVPSSNSLIMIDTSANLQRLKKLVNELDIPVSKQLSSIEVYNVQHTAAADLAKTLQALLAEGKKAATPKDKIFVTSYAPTNSLLVSAPQEDLKEIKRIIDGIDTVRPQVLVEAAIIEVSVNKAGSLGVDWIAGAVSQSNRGAIGASFNLPSNPLVSIGGAIIGGGSTSSSSSGSSSTTPSSTAAVAALQGLSGFNVGILGGNITFNGQTFPALGAFIKAVASQDDVNILSTPQILTMNNEEAEIVVGSNVPYLTSSRLDSAGNPINTFDYRDVGVKLKIKPYINKDGLVYLTLYQEVTQVTSATVGTGTSTQPAPTTLKRSTKTTVGVKDSQTIVISGLIQNNSERTTQGIPFLSSIPVIGALFGSQSKNVSKTNLLVFVTPRIIYSSEKIEEISQKMQKEQERLINQENTTKQEKKKEIERTRELEKE
ncbi:MAG TPA: secretin N-terminal domain-containing protein [Syntrophorhabdales bacterium]|nr:secretin N-terminal domain-containing protein [Syntrophorhabdales bacterium]